MSSPIDLLPLLLIFGVFYFLVLRPQVREKQDHDKLVASLAKDDEIVTASGVHGKIVMVEADTVQLEVADRVRIVIDQATVAKRQGPAPVPATEATPASSKT